MSIQQATETSNGKNFGLKFGIIFEKSDHESTFAFECVWASLKGLLKNVWIYFLLRKEESMCEKRSFMNMCWFWWMHILPTLLSVWLVFVLVCFEWQLHRSSDPTTFLIINWWSSCIFMKVSAIQSLFWTTTLHKRIWHMEFTSCIYLTCFTTAARTKSESFAASSSLRASA